CLWTLKATHGLLLWVAISIYFGLTARSSGRFAGAVWITPGILQSMVKTTCGSQISVLSNSGTISGAGLPSFGGSIRLRDTMSANQYYRQQATRCLQQVAHCYC